MLGAASDRDESVNDDDKTANKRKRVEGEFQSNQGAEITRERDDVGPSDQSRYIIISDRKYFALA